MTAERHEGIGRDVRIGSPTLIVAVIVSTILSVVVTVVLGTGPRAADTGEQVVRWFQEHRDSVRWSVWAFTADAPLLALVYALLRRLLPAPHRDMFLIGGVTVIVTTSVQSWLLAGLALHADRLEPATARTVLDVAVFFGPVLTAAFITMIAPVAVLAWRGSPSIPRWLGVLGTAAVVEQAAETVTIFGSSGFTEPGGPMNLQLGAGLVLLWTLAFAVWAGFQGRFHVAPT